MKIRGIRVLILCNEKDSFESVEVYLAHKGAYVQLTQSMDRFLFHLKDFNPNYVIVSIDNDDSYVMELIKKLSVSSSGVEVIPTTESQSISKSMELDELGIEHTFFPPLSGKKLENILKFLESRKEKKAQTISYEKDDEEVVDENVIDFQADYEKNKVVSSDDEELIKQAINYEMGGDDSGAKRLVNNPESIEELEEIENTIDYTKTANQFLQEALNSLDYTKSVNHPDSLLKVKKFTVYSIQHESMQGYMLTVFDAEEVSDETAKKVEQGLVECLTEKISGHFELHRLKMEMQPFDFQEWVSAAGGALSSFEVDECVVSWAFIESEDSKFEFEKTVDENMVGVDLNNIQPNVKVNNNLYIHMPKNGRFMLYTKKGGQVLEKQFKKLKKYAVEKIHLHKDDVKSFKDYKLENDIRNLVSKHNKKSA